MADNRNVLKVLHLATHAGGGVGTVLRALIKNSCIEGGFVHTLATLESLNPLTSQWCVKHQINYLAYGWQRKDELFSLIESADIVHIHWWNHPLLHALLAYHRLPKMRAVLWAHVNGMFAPQLFFKAIIDFPDFFVLAAPMSKKSGLIADRLLFPCNHIRMIQSNAGIPEGVPKKVTKPEGFRAGYVGTVEYSKMHKDFISLWEQTQILDYPLIVCGGPLEKALKKEAMRRNVAERFDIRGQVNNVPEVLLGLHAFVYPLTDSHYGTGEQVLIEAMALGAVPVVLDNPCEADIVIDKETGIVAKGRDDFVNGIFLLKNHPDIRQKMSENGRKYVQDRFDIKKTVLQWHRLYREMLDHAPRTHHLTLSFEKGVDRHSPAQLLFNAYGDSDEKRIIMKLLGSDAQTCKKNILDLPPVFFSKTRGSPFHYQKTLGPDPLLEKICRTMENAVTKRKRLNKSF